MVYKTEQESFWASDFGNDYIRRNSDKKLISSNIHFLSNALKRCSKIENCIEFGSNIGNNLIALKYLLPEVDSNAIEINKNAVKKLREIMPEKNIYNESILEFNTEKTFDLVLIKGVLIHLNLSYLRQVYAKLVKCCSKYLLLCEYYNPTPVSINYRGHEDKLFKRDFAGELLDNHSEMSLLDYGFLYRNDPIFPGSDTTWFLLEKS